MHELEDDSVVTLMVLGEDLDPAVVMQSLLQFPDQSWRRGRISRCRLELHFFDESSADLHPKDLVAQTLEAHAGGIRSSRLMIDVSEGGKSDADLPDSV